LYEKLLTKHNEKKAEKIAAQILSAFAKTAKVKLPKEVKSNEKFVGKELVTEQPIHFSNKEVENIKALVDRIDDEPKQEELDALFDDNPRNIDLAMFGRMIAKRPDKNIDAAVQVGHAISINEVEIEDDFFTAVDDLNKHGSAHMGEQEFVSAIYYLYICIDHQLLLKNLGEDKELTDSSLKALVTAAAMIAPTGKQNSFAHRARAFYILAEKGDAQPRNLSLAFLKAMPADDPEKAIDKLRTIKNKFDTAYSTSGGGNQVSGPAVSKVENFKEMNLFGNGILADILNFVVLSKAGGSNE
jgi:CRISPR system Cascade subunit CasC